MKKPTKFKKKWIASVVAASALTGISSTVIAQNNSEYVEEVVVTGIRASLTRSMDVKRNAVGVVDAISSEDIGKMPDSNLAESLQRITGVSIDRVNGEGSKVTVRGFDAKYNMVTLNGRAMPSNSYDSRAFDFGDLASESVSGLEVFKTSKANIASGGIGATINIKTLRPLESPGLKASLGVKAAHDTTVRSGDDVTPEVSGLFSNTFADDTIGIALTGSYQKRDSATTGANNQQWNTSAYSSADFVKNNGAIIENEPEEGQLFSTPIDLRYTLGDSERTRINGQLTLQYQPTDRLTATLDYTYSENEWLETRIEQSLWFVNARSHVVFDDETVATPVLITETLSNPKDVSFARQIFNGINENKAAGFNLSFDVTDDLNLSLDYNNATSGNRPAEARGNSLNASVAANVIKEQTVDWSRDLPTMIVSIDDTPYYTNDDNGDPTVYHYIGNGNGVLDAPDMTTTAGTATWQAVDNDLEQIRLDGTWNLDDNTLQFGIEQRTNEYVGKQRADCCLNMGNWGGADPRDVPDSFWSPLNFAGALDGHSMGDSFTGGMDWDFDEVTEWGGSQQGLITAFDGFPDGKFQAYPRISTFRGIEEEIQAAYVQFAVRGEIAGMPYNALTGLRYEQTDITSNTTAFSPLYIEWVGDDDFNMENSSGSNNISRSASYSHTLPNLDFDIALRDDLKARFSIGKTIARPTYDLMRADTGCCDVRSYSADQGNPGLLPLESVNLDVSVEWYYDDSSYVSIGAYSKDTDKFYSTQAIDQNLFDLRDPTKGLRATTAFNELVAEGVGNPSPADIWARVLQNDGQVDDGTALIVANEDDPLAVWHVNTPVNNKKARIHGMEFAVQHIFGESGFGAQANYTTVNGDVSFNNNSIGTAQFALVGLSDTANLMGFYDKNGLQVRVTYNWRDKFLDTTNAWNNEPGYTEAFGTVDANISYDINDNLSVALEGLNLTGEDKRRHGRSEAQLWRIELYGPRYMLGARYTF